EGRLQPVLHVLRLAQHRLRAVPVLQRALPAARARVLPSQPVAEHAGHPDRVPPDGRAPRLPGAPHPRGDARRELRHLRPAVRGARVPHRVALPLERPAQLRAGEPAPDAGADLPLPPPGQKRARLRVLPVIATTPRKRKTESFQLDDDPLWYKDALIYELHVR